MKLIGCLFQLLGQNDCPRYDQIEEEINESDEVKKMNEYYQVIFLYKILIDIFILSFSHFLKNLKVGQI